jgi:hypothetical protein
MKTIDLELAKELQSVCKEKGITMPESEFQFGEDRFGLGVHRDYVLLKSPIRNPQEGWLVYPAYTLDELLGWLPKEIITKSNLIAELRIGYRKNVFGCWYEYADNDRTILYSGEIVDSLCRLLIWTIKEGYLK